MDGGFETIYSLQTRIVFAGSAGNMIRQDRVSRGKINSDKIGKGEPRKDTTRYFKMREGNTK